MEVPAPAGSYGFDKENSPVPAKKKARKSSTSSKRVSFSDTVSVRHFEKLDASPAMSTRSRRSSITFNAVVVSNGPPREPATSNAEPALLDRTLHATPLSHLSLEPAQAVSPAQSDRSDVFFSPQESTSPMVSLSSLLQQEEGSEAAIPRLANLLYEDARPPPAAANHDDVTMEITLGVGGILAANGGLAECHDSPGHRVPNTPPPPLQQQACHSTGRPGEASDDDTAMDMTGMYGGIKEAVGSTAWYHQTPTAQPAPTVTAPAAAPTVYADTASTTATPLPPSAAPTLDSGPSRRASTARRRRSSLGTMLGVLPEEPQEHFEAEKAPPPVDEQPPIPEEEDAPSVPSPPKPAEKRRFSLSDKLQAVSSRLWRFTSSQDDAQETEPQAEGALSHDSPSPSASKVVVGGAGAGNAEASQAPLVATFDEYLEEAGVSLEALAAMPPSESKAMAPIVDIVRGDALSNRLMTAMVLNPELDQLHWANDELSKCIGMLQDGYSRMEEYITENAPSFFTAPEMKIEQAKLEKLAERCRQTARVFWYDWRVTLESDLGTKLTKAEQSLDSDLAHLQQNAARIRSAEAQIRASRPVPRPSTNLAALEEEAAQIEAQLAQREVTIGRIAAQRSALVIAVQQAEAELIAKNGEHEAKQSELSQLRQRLNNVHAEPMNVRDVAEGRELLDSLQVSVCWRPTLLTSTRLTLRFGNHFEVRVAMRPDANPENTIESVLLTALESSQQGAAETPPHLVVLHTLFANLQVQLAPSLRECRSALALRAIVGQIGLTLGRALELSSEVEDLAARVILRAIPQPNGCVAISIRRSYLAARIRFELMALLSSERPDTPIQWQLVQVQSLDSTRADELRESFDALASRYTRGFGRWHGMLAALDASLQLPALE